MEYNATSLSKPNNVRDLVAQEVPGLLYNVWTDRQITTNESWFGYSLGYSEILSRFCCRQHNFVVGMPTTKAYGKTYLKILRQRLQQEAWQFVEAPLWICVHYSFHLLVQKWLAIHPKEAVEAMMVGDLL